MDLESYDRELAIGQIMVLGGCSRDDVISDAEKIQSLCGLDFDEAITFLLQKMERDDAILRSLDLVD